MKTCLSVILKTFLWSSLLIGAPLSAQETSYTPSPENLKAREEFSKYKFGIFLHWGIYSMFAQGEHYMNMENIDCHEYAKAASGFYPSKFDAREWVQAIKAAGARYICFTSRHHDGFSMFDTKYSDYDIVDATPFKRDVVKELAEACKAEGIKLHLYYSHLDWTRDDYYPLGGTGHGTGRTNHGEWSSYYQFMNNQLTELLTNYGSIGAIWFDGMWDKPDFDWRLGEQYALIHRLQPACLVGNNHHKKPYDGEDFQMFERDLPGENKTGFSGESEISNLPLETCETITGSWWGYRIKDQDYKSTRDLVRMLVKASGKGANLLLNIGPQPNGELPSKALDRLKGIGEWLDKYGETIYDTTAGDVMTAEWGTTTRKGNTLYLHILADRMPEHIILPADIKIKKAVLFDSGEKVNYEKIKDGTVLYTASLNPDTDCIVTLTVAN